MLKDEKGNSKGFGFVCFKEPKFADAACKELNGKELWSDLSPLYVNFAMKKNERKEMLKREKAELFRNFQKLTIYVKIKNEAEIVRIFI